MSGRERNVLYAALAVVAAIALVKYLFAYFVPFVVAIFLAVLIDPLVNALERKAGLPRGLSVLGVLALSFLLIGSMFFLVGAELARDAGQLLEALPGFERILQDAPAWVARAQEAYTKLPVPLQDGIGSVLQKASTVTATIAGGFLAALKALPGIAFTLVIAAVATFFLSRDGRAIERFILELVPPRHHGYAAELRREMVRGLAGFMRAQLIVMFITAVLAVTGLSLAGIKYAWLLGVLAGLLEVIPMVGPGGVFVPVALSQVIWGDVPKAVAVVAALGVIVLVRQLSEPRIVGSQLGIHPLTSLVAVYTGIEFFGVKGFILGPLLAVAAKALLKTAQGSGGGHPRPPGPPGDGGPQRPGLRKSLGKHGILRRLRGGS
ncbi:MAG: sporulation integral membrane protein YtvI [Firmicutes bacterium]|nr:sporulation integral membrane protein YtvI [Bacillota bacterium]